MLSPITPQQFSRALDALDLDVNTAATLLRVTTRAIRYWQDGSRKVPWPVVRFFDYLQAKGVSGASAIEAINQGRRRR